MHTIALLPEAHHDTREPGPYLALSQRVHEAGDCTRRENDHCPPFRYTHHTYPFCIEQPGLSAANRNTSISSSPKEFYLFSLPSIAFSISLHTITNVSVMEHLYTPFETSILIYHLALCAVLQRA